MHHHPRRTHTRTQNTDATPHRHEWAPREFLEDILGWKSTTKAWYEARDFAPPSIPGAMLVSAGVACQNWSFHIVLKKMEVEDEEAGRAVGQSGAGGR